jgi:hypothetical protein
MRARDIGIICAALAVAAGCGEAGSSASGGGGGSVAPRAAAGPAHEKSPSGGLLDVAQGAPGQLQDANVVITKNQLPKIRSTIIKTGRLSLRVGAKAVAAAVPAVGEIAADYGGYTLSTTSTGTKHREATIVLRVPAAFFDRAMNALRGVGHGTVLADVRTGEDVGQEFVDLGARARNLRAQSKALLRLMDKAVSVSDTIRVQNQLFDVQGQLDQLEGRLRYLHDQADMSTITVSLSQTGAGHHRHHHSPPTALGSALRRGWHLAVGVVTAVIVAAGLVVPVAALAALALLAGLRLAPRMRRLLQRLRRPEPDTV